MNIQTPPPNAGKLSVSPSPIQSRWYLLDALFIVVTAFLLYYGAFWKSPDLQGAAIHQNDIAHYQCYTTAFWKGVEALKELPGNQCDFIIHPLPGTPIITQDDLLSKLANAPGWIRQLIATQSPTQPFHALPNEYPLIVMLPFSLAAIAPQPFYPLAFALLMTLTLSGIYVLLKRFASPGRAVTFLLLLIIGCWGTALGRYDLIPSALTLMALLYAERKRWIWAYTLLALATLFKFYPLILLLPFFIAQQRAMSGKWFSWHRFAPLGSFVVLCTVVMSLSLALSVAGTLGPLSYFGDRPIQVESTSASLLWLTHTLGDIPLTYGFSFGSRNVFSPLSPLITSGGTVVLLGGLLLIFWLQWRQKITLATTLVLTLLLVLFAGKVFSSQYLIWVAPLIAYNREMNARWVLAWGMISLLTTLIYPFLYERASFPFGTWLPDFHLTVLIRNILLGLFICSLLYTVLRNPRLPEQA
jgi:hypothetical protein